MKRQLTLVLFVFLTAFFCSSAIGREKTPLKMGSLMESKDSTDSYGRRLEQRLFISKGEFGVGAQFSYLDLTSSDSQLLMLLQNFNAYAKTFSVSPLVSYAFADNQSVGVQLKYSTSDAVISQADFSLLSDDLKLDMKDIEAHNNSIQASAFYRSCIGLDRQGRFGLFNDILLSYSRGRTSFAYNGAGLDAYTISNKVGISIHPGLELFVTNNISVQFSIGIGGVSYTGTKCIKASEVTGRRDASNARFYLDMTDIAFGMTLHL
ncbi:MAG TPA: hypothetical protein DHU72_00330 [Rikenellaceae bacterium]|nr:hypothetical protein [Rikenellaceae bacterium]HCZ21959.1 hypothetical protein [Rikenellaceae bacterium]